MDYHLILFALFVLYWIGTAIFRFFKWAGRQITGGGTGTNPVQQAIAEAQRQSQVPQAEPGPPPTQAPRPAQTLPTRAPSLVTAAPHAPAAAGGRAGRVARGDRAAIFGGRNKRWRPGSGCVGQSAAITRPGQFL